MVFFRFIVIIRIKSSDSVTSRSMDATIELYPRIEYEVSGERTLSRYLIFGLVFDIVYC